MTVNVSEVNCLRHFSDLYSLKRNHPLEWVSNLWLALATLSNEELSWTMYKIYNIVILYDYIIYFIIHKLMQKHLLCIHIYY